MQLSDSGLALIKNSEGLKTHTYNDVAGFPTIGYGHKLMAGESFPNDIDETRATALLLTDVREAEQAVTRLVKVGLPVRQFSLCGWEAASSQGRQAHWRGKLAASFRLFRFPAGVGVAPDQLLPDSSDTQQVSAK
jgi:hypothetical protein